MKYNTLAQIYLKLFQISCAGWDLLKMSDILHGLATIVNDYQLRKSKILREEGEQNMTQEQLNQLARIYNTLLVINTKGDDTLVMADCIRALKQLIEGISVEDEPKTAEVVEPEEE